ncbi:unnamed protein product [Nezara viridula]|uniref:RNA-binding protein NOB1 n=1 Tax=Nezara viridula TaxID=85310 RepID=A0A9P0MK19_NEZVI|nr:unnamed protein product [Nezara viridula]
MTPKVEHLVVDTSAFIRNTQLQEIAENLFTVAEVVNEIKSKRQLRRLVVLPYELQLKDVDPESVAAVKAFSMKTGDYPALSSTDLKVLALTYQLHKEKLGLDGIKTEPTTNKSIEAFDHSLISSANVVGFHLPSSEVPDIDEVTKKLGSLECNGSDNEEEEEEDEEEEEYDSDPPLDDDDWITPGNVADAKRELSGAAELSEDSPPPKVACLSTDFAIQNVLKQMGLSVVTLEGLLIRQVRTFILRCYACFKTTSLMDKVFCPNCGNKTLKRVAVTVDNEGKEVIHINFRRPITSRGKKFPLPKFKGGKHSNNPIICEDQRVPQQRPSKVALSKMNPLEPDYIAGVSPFTVRDVNSRAAVLGVLPGGEVKYWMRKNPNQVVKRRRKK